VPAVILANSMTDLFKRGCYRASETDSVVMLMLGRDIRANLRNHHYYPNAKDMRLGQLIDRLNGGKECRASGRKSVRLLLRHSLGRHSGVTPSTERTPKLNWISASDGLSRRSYAAVASP
jgi:hypothetical protein